MSDGTEQRTTGDGALMVDRPTTRTDAIQPLVDAVRRLEESLDRAVKLAEDNGKTNTEPRPLTLRQRILGTDE